MATTEYAAKTSKRSYVAPLLFPSSGRYRPDEKPVARLLKRGWNFTVSLVLLLLLLPTLLVIALCIKLDSPGPVLDTSERIGKKGRVFSCFKFRTMTTPAEALKPSLSGSNERYRILFKIKDDPRVTATGRALKKYGLDELPQLLNVLRGDMSLVGAASAGCKRS